MDHFLESLSISFRHLMDFVHGPTLFLALLWAGLLALTITLIVMMYTRWGQMHVLAKCLFLSVLAHFILAGYSTRIAIEPMAIAFQEHIIRVSLNEKLSNPRSRDLEGDVSSGKKADGTRSGVPAVKPWEGFADVAPLAPANDDLPRTALNDLRQPQRVVRNEQTGLPGGGSLDALPLAEAASPQPEGVRPGMSVPQPAGAKTAESIEAPKAMRRDGARTEIRDLGNARLGTPGGGSGKSLARVARAGSPTSLLDRSAPIPTLRDVKPTNGPGPADAIPGVADAQPKHAAGQVAEPYNPDATAGGSESGMPGGTGSGLPGPSVDAIAGASVGPVGPADDSLRFSATGGKNDGYASIGSGVGVIGGVPGGGPGGGSGMGVGPAVLPPRRSGGPSERDVPEIYRARVAPNRSRLAERQGANEETERSVLAALKFIAANQEEDGHWDARLHEGGRELRIAGRDRQGAGGHSNTGMTGLALLAFLASNNTHVNGEYSNNVRRGLEYLMRVQRRDGGLGGDGLVYEYMYSHAMAAFALGEAYGMTNDERLERSVRRGVEFTLSMQNKSTGGWRYTTGDPGDTSQLGWQLMALKSADLAGVRMPEESRQGVLRFLKSVSYGQSGGLAAYRAGEEPTRTMTAEALVCRQFLGLAPETTKAKEAADYLLDELPGQGKVNIYYWYYGTLAMHQMQGVYWERWNAAMQKALITRQRTTGPLAGSWDPDELWGTYGGRLYNTSLSTLCLEVYYRFLPLYLHNPLSETK